MTSPAITLAGTTTSISTAGAIHRSPFAGEPEQGRHRTFFREVDGSAQIRRYRDPTPPNTFVLFEGAYIYHGVTALGEGERRVILSMTFCTKPAAGRLQALERRFKDIAYFGIRALWT